MAEKKKLKTENQDKSCIQIWNAIDKAVGYALLNGFSTEDLILFSSGRIPLDVAKKVIRSGILRSISGPQTGNDRKRRQHWPAR